METPRKFITAVINLRGVSTNKTIICFIAMQTYKELIKESILSIHNKYVNNGNWRSLLYHEKFLQYSSYELCETQSTILTEKAISRSETETWLAMTEQWGNLKSK